MRATWKIAAGAILIEVGILLVVMGTDFRFRRLEARGMVPVDDLATVRDLQALEDRLDGEAIPAPGEEGGPPGPVA